MLTPAQRRGNSLLAAVAVLAACSIFGASLYGSIFHLHNSPSAEATCPICQVGHCMAVHVAPVGPLPFPQRLSGKVIIPPRSAARLNPFLGLDLTRAPPSA